MSNKTSPKARVREKALVEAERLKLLVQAKALTSEFVGSWGELNYMAGVLRVGQPLAPHEVHGQCTRNKVLRAQAWFGLWLELCREQDEYGVVRDSLMQKVEFEMAEVALERQFTPEAQELFDVIFSDIGNRRAAFQLKHLSQNKIDKALKFVVDEEVSLPPVGLSAYHL